MCTLGRGIKVQGAPKSTFRVLAWGGFKWTARDMHTQQCLSECGPSLPSLLQNSWKSQNVSLLPGVKLVLWLQSFPFPRIRFLENCNSLGSIVLKSLIAEWRGTFFLRISLFLSGKLHPAFFLIGVYSQPSFIRPSMVSPQPQRANQSPSLETTHQPTLLSQMNHSNLFGPGGSARLLSVVLQTTECPHLRWDPRLCLLWPKRKKVVIKCVPKQNRFSPEVNAVTPLKWKKGREHLYLAPYSFNAQFPPRHLPGSGDFTCRVPDSRSRMTWGWFGRNIYVSLDLSLYAYGG